MLIVTRSHRSGYSPSRLAQIAAEALEKPISDWAEQLLFRAIRNHVGSAGEIAGFLLELHKRTKAEHVDRIGRIERLLRQALRRRESDLQKSGRLSALGLPEVVPLAAT